MSHTGAMIALIPDEPNRYVAPGGEKPEDLHVTLAYLGKAADLTPQQQADILSTVAAVCESLILTGDGTVSGVGFFDSPDSEPLPVYASVDLIGLAQFRTILTGCLRAVLGDDALPSGHDFTPHMTLGYAEDEATALQVMSAYTGMGPIRFSQVIVAFAGQVTAYPLRGLADSGVVMKAKPEDRYTLMPWYVPDRLDAHQEWTDGEGVQKGLWSFIRKDDRRIRLQHVPEIVAGEMVEALTWPFEVTMPIHKADGTVRDVTFPANTAFMGVIWEPWAFDLVKKDKVTGLSMGGRAKRLRGVGPETVLKHGDPDTDINYYVKHPGSHGKPHAWQQTKDNPHPTAQAPAGAKILGEHGSKPAPAGSVKHHPSKPHHEAPHEHQPMGMPKHAPKGAVEVGSASEIAAGDTLYLSHYPDGYEVLSVDEKAGTVLTQTKGGKKVVKIDDATSPVAVVSPLNTPKGALAAFTGSPGAKMPTNAPEGAIPVDKPSQVHLGDVLYVDKYPDGYTVVGFTDAGLPLAKKDPAAKGKALPVKVGSAGHAYAIVPGPEKGQHLLDAKTGKADTPESKVEGPKPGPYVDETGWTLTVYDDGSGSMQSPGGAKGSTMPADVIAQMVDTGGWKPKPPQSDEPTAPVLYDAEGFEGQHSGFVLMPDGKAYWDNGQGQPDLKLPIDDVASVTGPGSGYKPATPTPLGESPAPKISLDAPPFTTASPSGIAAGDQFVTALDSPGAPPHTLAGWGWSHFLNEVLPDGGKGATIAFPLVDKHPPGTVLQAPDGKTYSVHEMTSHAPLLIDTDGVKVTEDKAAKVNPEAPTPITKPDGEIVGLTMPSGQKIEQFDDVYIPGVGMGVISDFSLDGAFGVEQNGLISSKTPADVIKIGDQVTGYNGKSSGTVVGFNITMGTVSVDTGGFTEIIDLGDLDAPGNTPSGGVSVATSAAPSVAPIPAPQKKPAKKTGKANPASTPGTVMALSNGTPVKVTNLAPDASGQVPILTGDGTASTMPIADLHHATPQVLLAWNASVYDAQGPQIAPSGNAPSKAAPSGPSQHWAQPGTVVGSKKFPGNTYKVLQSNSDGTAVITTAAGTNFDAAQDDLLPLGPGLKVKSDAGEKVVSDIVADTIHFEDGSTAPLSSAAPATATPGQGAAASAKTSKKKIAYNAPIPTTPAAYGSVPLTHVNGARTFTSNSDGVHWGEAWWADWRDNLSQDATKGIAYYTGSGYHTWNEKLRQGGKPSGQMKAAMDALNDTELPEAAILSRGIGVSITPDMVGSVFYDRGFQSTSAAPNAAFSSKKTIMRIHAPAGTKGAYLGQGAHSTFANGEMELLLPPGAAYRIDAVTQVGGTYYADVTLVAQGLDTDHVQVILKALGLNRLWTVTGAS